MATKAQERTALEKIRKIVEGLGEESYIGQAMDGVLEDAEQNIENDFWNSYRNRYEYVNASFERAEDEIATLKEQNKNLAAEMELAKRTMQDERKRANELASKYNSEKARADAAQLDTQDNAAALENIIKAQELEIIKLKAKLYDMMVGA